MAMKPKRIVRSKEAYARLGCGKTKFSEDYEFHDASEPYVPGTKIPRLKAVLLGPINKGFVEDELDCLITAIAELRDKPADTLRLYLTDQKPPKRKSTRKVRIPGVAAALRARTQRKSQ
jgi:hypothetical protein